MNKGRLPPMLAIRKGVEEDLYRTGFGGSKSILGQTETERWVNLKARPFGQTARNTGGLSFRRHLTQTKQTSSDLKLAVVFGIASNSAAKPRMFQIGQNSPPVLTSHSKVRPNPLSVKDPDHAMIESVSLDQSHGLFQSAVDNSFRRRKIEGQLRTTKMKMLTSKWSDSESLKKDLHILSGLAAKSSLVKKQLACRKEGGPTFEFNCIQEVLLLADAVQKDEYWDRKGKPFEPTENHPDPFPCELEAINRPRSPSNLRLPPRTLLKLKSTTQPFSGLTPKGGGTRQSTNFKTKQLNSFTSMK
jgi:hypothetical protein